MTTSICQWLYYQENQYPMAVIMDDADNLLQVLTPDNLKGAIAIGVIKGKIASGYFVELPKILKQKIISPKTNTLVGFLPRNHKDTKFDYAIGEYVLVEVRSDKNWGKGIKLRQNIILENPYWLVQYQPLMNKLQKNFLEENFKPQQALRRLMHPIKELESLVLKKSKEDLYIRLTTIKTAWQDFSDSVKKSVRWLAAPISIWEQLLLNHDGGKIIVADTVMKTELLVIATRWGMNINGDFAQQIEIGKIQRNKIAHAIASRKPDGIVDLFQVYGVYTAFKQLLSREHALLGEMTAQPFQNQSKFSGGNSGLRILVDETEIAVMVDVDTAGLSYSVTQQQKISVMNLAVLKKTFQLAKARDWSGLILIDLLKPKNPMTQYNLLPEAKKLFKAIGLKGDILGFGPAGLLEITLQRQTSPLIERLQQLATIGLLPLDFSNKNSKI